MIDALCIALAVAVQHVASVTVPNEELRWTAPAECPDIEQVREEILALRVESVVEELRVEGVVQQREDGRFSLDLSLTHPAGIDRRTFEADDCASLAKTAALLVAAASDPFFEFQATATEPDADDDPDEADDDDMGIDDALLDDLASSLQDASELADDDATEADVIDEPGVQPRPEQTRKKLRAGLRAEGLAGYGALPRGDFGVSGLLSLIARRVRGEIGVTYLAPSTANYPDEPGIGGRFTLVAGVLRVCPVWNPKWSPEWIRGRFEVPICFGVEGGALSGRGVGFREAQRRTSAWVTGTLRPGLVWAMTERLAVGVHIEGFAAFHRQEFAVEDRPVLHRPTIVGFRGALALEVRLP